VRPEQRLRVHVAALASQAEVFWVTEARFAAACARHPDLGRRLDVDWSWDLDRFEDGVRDAEILIGWRFDTADLAARAPALRWIQLTGAGSEHLQPLDWLPPGVALTNNSGAHGPKAGEFAGTAILLLNHGFPGFATSQRARVWKPNFTTTIADKTLLVIGLGAMGGAVARWAKQKLGLRVLGVRRSGRPHRYVDRVVATADLDELLPEADFVVVTVPLTAETENLLDRRRLACLKPGAGLVNMGRARVVDYAALADLLEDGHLSGAVLDVFDPEPLPESSPLWSTPNLVIVPHCSSDDDEHYIARTLDIFFDSLGRYLAGRPLKNRISLRRQY
jgi:phosphoglycerate dehydrogenase-like enzyme